MSANLYIALQITLIGMGLVFGAILLLWLILSLLVRLTGQRVRTAKPRVAERDLKRRAAIVAVAAALAQQASSAQRNFPLPPTALVSAWQAVSRANNLKRGGRSR